MKKIIIANWKSNKSTSEAQNWVDTFLSAVNQEALEQKNVILLPSFVQLTAVSHKIKETTLALGMQDISPFPSGSYTGAVSAHNVLGEHIEYVLVGHSERRFHFSETDEHVFKKIVQVIDSGMIPIVCVDEPYLESQAVTIDSYLHNKLIVAYEPIAAIGSGDRVSVGKVEEIKELVYKHFGKVPFIYGGSVEENSIAEYLIVCDGVLVGTASLDAHQFAAVVNSAKV